MVAIGDLKYVEGCLSYRITGPPEESQCSTLGIDVSWSPVTEYLIKMGTPEARSSSAVRDDLDTADHAGFWIAPSKIGSEAVVSREIKQQPGFWIRSC